MKNTTSWTQVDKETQQYILREMEENAIAAITEMSGDTQLANAWCAAAKELSLWIEGAVSDPFAAWMNEHSGELHPVYDDKVVAIHLERGVIASNELNTFWDGSFAKQIDAQFPNEPMIYITTVPTPFISEEQNNLQEVAASE